MQAASLLLLSLHSAALVSVQTGKKTFQSESKTKTTKLWA
jgi:hypothetical protein